MPRKRGSRNVTKADRQAYLEALPLHGPVLAAEMAGRPYFTFAHLRQRDSEFARQCSEAVELGRETALALALRLIVQTLDPPSEPVFDSSGEPVLDAEGRQVTAPAISPLGEKLLLKAADQLFGGGIGAPTAAIQINNGPGAGAQLVAADPRPLGERVEAMLRDLRPAIDATPAPVEEAHEADPTQATLGPAPEEAERAGESSPAAAGE
ncbi:MAG: hypothetical protein MI741_22335 [Rhodospirillales bacterium]|nr:hypothetical protein [Rhodospirillales bacterium]